MDCIEVSTGPGIRVGDLAREDEASAVAWLDELLMIVLCAAVRVGSVRAMCETAARIDCIWCYAAVVNTRDVQSVA